MKIVTVPPGKDSYAFNAHLKPLEVTNVGVKGGGGILRTVGTPGLTRLVDVTQLEASSHYIFYCGPESKHVKDAKGNSISYTERNTQEIELIRCEAALGSQYVACGRFVGFDKLTVSGRMADGTRAKWCDTVEQSAPGAVPNAVLRVHHGGTALFEDMEFYGDAAYIGPMAEGDGGINTTGDERRFREAERLQSITFRRCKFDVNQFKITAGVKWFSFEDCEIRTRGAAIISTPFPYISRPASAGVFTGGALISKSTARPIAFSEADGSAKMRLNGTDIRSDVAPAAKKKA